MPKTVYRCGANVHPTTLADNFPALEGITNIIVFSTHVNALQSARRAYLETKPSEKVRKALKHKVRVSSKRYNNGEKVYYKRHGVGVELIGQDRKK